MHPTSGEWRTWRAGTLSPDGYCVRRWYEGRRPGRKLREQLEHRWVWELHHGKVPSGHDIHHRDHDRLNNALENLVPVPHNVHAQEHGRERRKWREVDGRWERLCAGCAGWLPETAYSSPTRSYCRDCRHARHRATYEPRNGVLRKWTRRTRDGGPRGTV